jgi:hypothetical protein
VECRDRNAGLRIFLTVTYSWGSRFDSDTIQNMADEPAEAVLQTSLGSSKLNALAALGNGEDRGPAVSLIV